MERRALGADWVRGEMPLGRRSTLWLGGRAGGWPRGPGCTGTTSPLLLRSIAESLGSGRRQRIQGVCVLSFFRADGCLVRNASYLELVEPRVPARPAVEKRGVYRGSRGGGAAQSPAEVSEPSLTREAPPGVGRPRLAAFCVFEKNPQILSWCLGVVPGGSAMGWGQESLLGPISEIWLLDLRGSEADPSSSY